MGGWISKNSCDKIAVCSWMGEGEAETLRTVKMVIMLAEELFQHYDPNSKEKIV